MLNHAEPCWTCVRFHIFHFPARPLWPHQFPGSIGAFGPFCSPWFDVHPSDEKESLEFAVCTTRPLTTSAPQTKMSCYVNTWIFDWNILKYHTSATRITIYRLSIYHYLSLQFSICIYIYICVCNIHLYLYVYWWIYVFVWLDHLTGVRGIFSELRAKATAWSLSHTDFWWIMMDHDAFLEFLHISPGFTFQTLQSMRIRAKQLRSGIPTHRPWCLRNAFECHRMPSILYTGRVDVDRSARHSSTLHHDTSSKQKRSIASTHSVLPREQPVTAFNFPRAGSSRLGQSFQKSEQQAVIMWNPLQSNGYPQWPRMPKDCLFRGANLETSTKNSIELEILKTLRAPQMMRAWPSVDGVF